MYKRSGKCSEEFDRWDSAALINRLRAPSPSEVGLNANHTHTLHCTAGRTTYLARKQCLQGTAQCNSTTQYKIPTDHTRTKLKGTNAYNLKITLIKYSSEKECRKVQRRIVTKIVTKIISQKYKSST